MTDGLDPLRTERAELDYWYAAATSRQAPDGLDQLDVTAGAWLVLTTTAPYPEAMQHLWRDAYGQWFPSNPGGLAQDQSCCAPSCTTTAPQMQNSGCPLSRTSPEGEGAAEALVDGRRHTGARDRPARGRTGPPAVTRDRAALVHQHTQADRPTRPAGAPKRPLAAFPPWILDRHGAFQAYRAALTANDFDADGGGRWAVSVSVSQGRSRGSRRNMARHDVGPW